MDEPSAFLWRGREEGELTCEDENIVKITFLNGGCLKDEIQGPFVGESKFTGKLAGKSSL
jgi:hypothetical protein